MIDLHCHILPGVDDGSDSMSTSLEMARIAQESGVRAIIATPHCAKPDQPANLLSRGLVSRFAELNAAVADAGLTVRIYPGMEIFVKKDFAEIMASGRLLTLANTQYMLVEFYFDESPELISRTIEQIRQSGKIPVIAHPERYFCTQWRPELAELWRKNGAVIQVNRGSIQGKLGAQAQKCAWEILRSGIAMAVASDAHGVMSRRPELRSVMLELGDNLSWSYASKLLIENPARILTGQPLAGEIRLPE